ncbi:thioesterase [Dactylosporangium roseum]|uniref:Thioesterase n=1 Tax=Dactylosporangium roseum TaxID=47989 RepID=A0ABY5ZED9_9ACTN|nr:alpha/beta fold hydrolase [Dactylosporangium roseum]UWZ39313.1 thioesterase [Dactylosporangium roseum]
MTGSGVWLQRWGAPARATHTLVCFPHAGGSASFYRGWAPRLPAAEVLAVCYPGRAQRIDEEPETDLRRMAYDVAADLCTHAGGRPLLLFGHSMGAAVALETARALESGGVPVAHLFASGSRDAPLPEPVADDGRTDTDEEAIQQLARMGGTSREMLDDPVFRELILPYVTADSRMFHAYRMAPEPVLRCPVTVLTGDRDTDADTRPWGTLTTGTVARLTARGDHFYLTNNPPYDVLATAMTFGDSNSRTP